MQSSTAGNTRAIACNGMGFLSSVQAAVGNKNSHRSPAASRKTVVDVGLVLLGRIFCRAVFTFLFCIWVIDGVSRAAAPSAGAPDLEGPPGSGTMSAIIKAIYAA